MVCAKYYFALYIKINSDKKRETDKKKTMKLLPFQKMIKQLTDSELVLVQNNLTTLTFYSV